MNRTLKSEDKPNEKIAFNYGDIICKTLKSFAFGNEMTYKSEDKLESLQNILDKANEAKYNDIVQTYAGNIGYGIQRVYIDENKEIKICELDPLKTIFIFSDDVQEKLLYVIQHWEKDIIHKNKKEKHTVVYSIDSITTYIDDIKVEEVNNDFNNSEIQMIPIFICKNNYKMKADFEGVIPLIDQKDFFESDLANTSAYFNDCIMYINNRDVVVTKEDVVEMSESRFILAPEKPEYIARPVFDNKEIIDRYEKNIFQLSGTPDVTDSGFMAGISGEAMKQKLCNTIAIISEKQTYFKEFIERRNECILGMMRYLMYENVPSYAEPVLTINLPENKLETAQMINQLKGIVSDKTLRTQISFVNDEENEVNLLKEQNSINTFEVDLNKEDDEDEE